MNAPNELEEITSTGELMSIDKEEHILKWDYTGYAEKPDAPDPPELIVQLTTKDFTTTSLQICFWGLTTVEALEKTDEAGNVIKYIDNHIAGECYISLNRIFSLHPEIVRDAPQIILKLPSSPQD